MKRKDAVQLSAMVSRGDQITVLYADHVYRAKAKSGGGRQIRWQADKQPRQQQDRFAGNVRRRDEGRTWARGWDTDAALALRVAAMLAR